MRQDHAPFPIVGVGASAGGVEALEGLFRGMPADPGVGVVIVTHLSPERESMLHEIVGRYTALPVEIASDGTLVCRNCVYVLPADAILSIEDGRLRIHRLEGGRRERKPIDIFFSALAKDRGEYAASIVLSGGDGDGALGTKAIKERGGLTLAQVADGHGPAHPDMPDSAISTGFVDFAIPVDQMGAKLVEFAHSFQLLDDMAAQADQAEAGGDPLLEVREEIYGLLRNRVGHDFGGYKTRTFMRRVQRRMQVVQLGSFEAYIERLRQDPKEVTALFRDLLINVTNFFRDADAFKALEELVIPKLFEGRGADKTVRVWVPGCATGEEVFSIAMLLREAMDGLKAVPRVQVFATDIDEHALNVARAGRYPEALLDTVSEARRKRFFIADAGSYVLSKEVRDLCTFSPHSVIRDPPFSRIDLVSCRNLLIYFGPEVQNQVIPTFHYSLRPGGYLFLGTSENVSQFGELFSPVDKKQRIFRSREDRASTPRVPLIVGGFRTSANPAPGEANRRSGVGGMALRQAVEAQVLDRFAPPHVVVNREGDIVYYSSRTGKYLEPAAGAPSRQLLILARKGLRLDLRAAFRDAVESEKTVVREGIPIDGEDGRVQMVAVTIDPIVERSEDELLFLVMFDDQGPPLSPEDALAQARTKPDGAAAHLERELRETRERLQSLIEEYETAVEELKSSNEELVSVNEELQSTNEELEASKEELQSLNEELHTVNVELNGKVDMLDQANADLQNLFESTQIATVFLDRSLAIRSFTPAVSSVFNILSSDRGRPITDLSSRITLPTLAEDVSTVLSTGRLLERRIEQAEGTAHFLVRIAPYRNQGRPADGVVVTFVDVTNLTRAEAQQRVLVSELNHRVKNMIAVVISLAEQTEKGASSAEAFNRAFLPRLRAMASSYELLSKEKWTEARMDELVAQQLKPFGLERIDAHGPDLKLAPPKALSMGLILHELATNAAKYGALSKAEGRLSLDWTTVSNSAGDGLEMTWREIDGPTVIDNKRRGFGLKLVERETSYRLGGEASFDFQPQGLAVTIRFPISEHDEP